MPIFKKFLSHQTTKNANILKTVLDSGILTKFLIHRVSLWSSYPNCQKILVSPKMAAILNFSKRLQNTKMHISKKPCEIVILTKFLTHWVPVSLQSSHSNFQNIFVGAASDGSAFSFPLNFVTIGLILFKFGRCMMQPWGIFTYAKEVMFLLR